MMKIINKLWYHEAKKTMLEIQGYEQKDREMSSIAKMPSRLNRNTMLISSFILAATLGVSGCGDNDNSGTSPVVITLPKLVVTTANARYEVASDVAASTQLMTYTMPKTGSTSTTSATAVVFTPKTPQPANGYPIVVWAHGTTGVADACAPSASTTLGGTNTLIAALLQQGYVVVAPDYEGLGSDGVHPFLNATSEGNSIVYSALATHQLLPNTSTSWAIVGHSQGGHAALAAAERADTIAGNPMMLKGVVAYAPASNLDYIITLGNYAANQAATSGDSSTLVTAQAGINTFAAYVAQGIKQLHPEFDIGTAFGNNQNTQTLVKTNAEKACISTLGNDFGLDIARYYQTGGTGLYQGLKSDYLNLPLIKQFIDTDSKLATRAVNQPTLIIQGQADSTVPYQATQVLVNQIKIAGWTNVVTDYSSSDNHSSIVINKLGAMNNFLTTYLPAK